MCNVFPITTATMLQSTILSWLQISGASRFSCRTTGLYKKILAWPSGNSALAFSFTCLELFWTSPKFSQQWGSVRLASRASGMKIYTTIPFTPESDQCQNSPAASQEIWHHTVWRIWLFIAYSDERWLYYKFSLHHAYNCFLKGRENTLSELRSERALGHNFCRALGQADFIYHLPNGKHGKKCLWLVRPLTELWASSK